MNRRTAIVVGASGLVGKQLLELLLEHDYYRTVVSMTRMYQNIKHERLMQYVLDYDRLDEVEELISATDIYCCLGTTMKKAGNKDSFRKVDFDYVHNIARMARQNGAEGFYLVSALGANTNSRAFYNRVKGEIEDAVKSVGFESLHIFRPSLLLGDRGEYRRNEEIGKRISRLFRPFMVGPFSKYKPLESSKVAKAMFIAAQEGKEGLQVYESNQIRQMVR